MPIIETSQQQPSVNVYPNGGGNYGGGNGFFGDGAFGSGGGLFFLLILFFFMMFFMGWGNNGNAAGNNGGVAYVPYMPYGAPQMYGGGGDGGNSAAAAVRNGFDQAAVVNGIASLNTAMQTGFSNAEVSRCNQQANVLAQMNNNQNAIMAGLQNHSMALQNCCCENRAGIADVKYALATEACADRAAVTDALTSLTAQNNANMNAMANMFNAGIQSIKDQMCNDKIDAKNEKIADLERQLTMANLAASQNAQTAAIQSGQRNLANEIEQYVAPNAIPAYIVQNPNCCAQQNYGCGCRQCGG